MKLTAAHAEVSARVPNKRTRAQTKVPMIWRVPGLPPRRSTTPAGHADILPTLVNLAGGKPDAEMEGRSLVDARSHPDLFHLRRTLNPDTGRIRAEIAVDDVRGLSEFMHMTPAMGEEYWYPLYEKMVQMDVPGLVHGASCKNPRESFHGHFITEESIAILSLVDSKVFEDFPKLKLIISHGGGSVPYQVGRWRSQLRGPKDTENFDQRLRQLYFDTALYNVESLELLFKVVGPDRCLFGTERPGAGSKTDPRTGRWYDDVRPQIESISWLNSEQKEQIFHKNATQVFTRFKQ